MFDNVSKKIKTLAEALCLLWICIPVLIVTLLGNTNIIVIVIATCIGAGIGWCSTVCLYGFGELISQATALRETNEQILYILENQHNNENIQNIVEHQPENNIGNTESV